MARQLESRHQRRHRRDGTAERQGGPRHDDRGDGFFAKLAQKAVGFAFDKAIDMYFGDGPGKQVDAGTMHRIDTKTPGFVVMAADKDEGRRILSAGTRKGARRCVWRQGFSAVE